MALCDPGPTLEIRLVLIRLNNALPSTSKKVSRVFPVLS
jgi:hypothetical protein